MTRLDWLRANGIRRVGSPARGFRYVHSSGKAVTPADKERIRGLRIPPAWIEVHIALSDRPPLQAIGKDRAGRWQYLYHAREAERRERRKHEKLIRFAHALPRLRKAIARDLRRGEASREVVMACILRILSTCFLRPGSQVYANENGSFGIATLRSEVIAMLSVAVGARHCAAHQIRAAP